MKKFILVYSTASSKSEAENIANALISNRLAACVNVVAEMSSFYFWDKKTCKGNEHMLIIKTREDLYGAVEKKILDIHSYETPCVFSIPITKIEKSYSIWLDKNMLERLCSEGVK